jgi:two-component system CheB/CheR fusion protein
LITAVPSQFHIRDLRALLVTVIASGLAHEEIIEADGRIYRLGVYPYRDLRDQTAGTIMSFIDETDLRTTQRELESTISHLRETQTELSEAKVVAEQANNAKSDFLANMSHELRTPLNAVLGFAQLMADQMWGDLGDERYREYANIIVDSGQHLLSLINQVLDMSVIEAGRIVLHESNIALDEVISSVARLLSSQAERREIRFATEIAQDLPLFLGDLTAIQRVLFNLVGNALKFTPPGGTVTVSAIADDEGFTLRVADTGIGIKAEDLARVLMPFEQGGLRTVREREGVGLGLPISKSLVEIHGGRLSIESEEGRGTVVSVHLPADRRRPRA